MALLAEHPGGPQADPSCTNDNEAHTKAITTQRNNCIPAPTPAPGEGFYSDTLYHTPMVHAFIMVKTTAGTSEQLAAPIRDLETVSEAHVVAGDWDLIAEVDADEVYDVLKTASGGIQALEGVTDTKTYISMDE